MKNIFAAVLLLSSLLLSSLCLGQRTDTNVTQLPNPMPTWGGANGAGRMWQNPAFPGSLYVRITDATTANKGTLQTSDSGEPRLVCADGKHVIVRNTGGHSFVMAFDPATKKVSKTGIDSGYDLQCSKSDPLTMFGASKTQIHKVVAKPDWSSRASDVVLFDFASPKCLGVGFKPTWHGTFTISDDDLTFKTSFSNTGLQGTGRYTVFWSAAKGCSVYDSAIGVADGKTVDDGGNPPKPLVARFLLHEGGGGRDGRYAFANATLHTGPILPGGGRKSGCLSGPGTCLVDRPYIWEGWTTHVRPCAINADGHSTKGAAGFYTGKQQAYHEYADCNKPLTPMVKFPAGMPDQHGAGNSQKAPGDPIFMVSTGVPSVIPYPVWGYDEVLQIPTDGSLKVIRRGQTLNSGKSKYFIVQNAVGIDSPDGHVVFFTSDMGGKGALGYEADGVTPRGDVFALIWTK